MSRKLRIALAQTYPVSAPASVQAGADALEPLKHNLRTVVRWTAEAKKGGAEVVVFPEYFLQGLVEGKEVGNECATRCKENADRSRSTWSSPPSMP